LCRQLQQLPVANIDVTTDRLSKHPTANRFVRPTLGKKISTPRDGQLLEYGRIEARPRAVDQIEAATAP
jgi:hypothetical protein